MPKSLISYRFYTEAVRTINVYADDGTGPADDEVTSIVCIKLNDSKVADDAECPTDVLFVMYGALLHLGPDGAVVAVTDAESVLRDYPALLRQQGKPVPDVLPVGGTMAYRPVA